MHLKKLCLRHFRNYEQKQVAFQPGLNCIEGENGSGKSNLLEALHLISTGKSFRTHRLYDLIKHEEQQFALEATFVKKGVSHDLQIFFGSQGRKILYNQTPHTSFLPLFGLLPLVLLSPEDITIFTGSPGERRRFLDLHIAQIDPVYLHHLGRYQKAMKQRNALLKKGQERGLAPWEKLMAASASYLITKREQTLSYLQQPCQKHVSHLSRQREFFALNYVSSLESGTPIHYEQQWERYRKKDLEYGSTLLGPHRDDVLFLLENKEVKTYCSEGQKRCCLAALRLSEWERMKETLDSPPLFGIDDFGVHLDEERSHLLERLLRPMGQVFLTAPSLSFIQDAHIQTVKKDA